jgi:hypothetical protein
LKKKNRVLVSYQGKMLSVKELMSEWTGVVDFMMESVAVIESESEQVRRGPTQPTNFFVYLRVYRKCIL